MSVLLSQVAAELGSSEVEVNQLLECAKAIKERSYAPYSNFHVGSALMTTSRKMIPGCNVENSSYGLTICAERTALTTAVAQGERSFLAVVVTGDLEKEFIWPCGACRQFIVEFGNPLVISLRADGSLMTKRAAELLPNAFTPASLTSDDALAKRAAREVKCCDK
eukprot:TRINITY_DN2326_c0_g1::TRINITY_DN2326_c0_g1_i1::g.20713::m.20713 TRINITY_DN2326_c0_g1::TRINITY_DN2326_c0_g1_i1::g.20713  ORF type:complete len:165 (+),score=22.36,sp/Q54I82/CDD_DICDI/45.21/9e-38,dCMP_cyt_deam_1/PF00383.17/4.6e-17,dCMP_cyt_deam_2/PF08211.6/1.2e-08,dCMP_cyt_deam_2/PF08211.6/62,LmjF365940-deam/PF14421.1/1.5,LmjF365940-deam/PF14421.1/15 TRINITY_DN2326_c0_g1_i1:89-583(+)